jgi:hypothetical protein
MKNKTRDEDDANQSLFSAAGVRPNHPFSKTTHFADISVGVENFFRSPSQGSSFLATLGFEPESRWDSPSH